MSPLGGKSRRKGGFDDATSEEASRLVRRYTFGPPHSGKSADGTPGEGVAGCISEAWPLTFPAVFTLVAILLRFLSRPFYRGWLIDSWLRSPPSGNIGAWA